MIILPDSLKRFTRSEAAEYIGCSLTKLGQLVKSGSMTGTFYQIGKRQIFIADRLEQWILNGGEQAEGKEL